MSTYSKAKRPRNMYFRLARRILWNAHGDVFVRRNVVWRSKFRMKLVSVEQVKGESRRVVVMSAIGEVVALWV